MNVENLFFEYGEYRSESPFDFKKHSSIGCGGTAVIGFFPNSAEQLVSLLSRLERDGFSYVVVGNMTNVLPTDRQTQTVIVCLKDMSGVHPCKEGIYALSGTGSARLLKGCLEMGKTGLEFLTGVPCTVGGALYMNAGAAGVYVSEFVESVTVLRKGKLLTIPKEECQYAYKKSVFMKNGDIIVGGKFALKDGSVEEIQKRREYFSARRAHLPKGKSMGCVFKNPESGSAGEYLEKCGLKGLRVGKAYISEKHANFIINDGGATEADVKMLISVMKNAVYALYNIVLEEEIRYLD